MLLFVVSGCPVRWLKLPPLCPPRFESKCGHGWSLRAGLVLLETVSSCEKCEETALPM